MVIVVQTFTDKKWEILGRTRRYSKSQKIKNYGTFCDNFDIEFSIIDNKLIYIT